MLSHLFLLLFFLFYILLINAWRFKYLQKQLEYLQNNQNIY
jgi:hypothetical protein